MAERPPPASPAPLFAAGAGIVAALMALAAYAIASAPGLPDVTRAGAFIASGLCALGACVAFGLLAIAYSLGRRH